MQKTMKKVALITGASSGIGRELAFIHAENGGDLIIVARDEAKLLELKTEIEAKYNTQVMVLAKDLSADSAPQEVYDAIKAAGLEVDYLMNNAGFGGYGLFHERPWEEDREMIMLNIMALTALTRLFLPDFVQRKSGRILHTSSTAGRLPGPLQAVYFATKAYVNSFGNALAQEVKGTGVTVTNLLPGPVQTGFISRAGMGKSSMFKNAASAQKVASDGYKAMMAGKREVVSGLSIGNRILSFFLPFFPKRMVLKQVQKMQQL